MKLIARIIVAVIANGLGFVVAAYWIPGFVLTKDWKQIVILAAVFTVLNWVLKPILKLFLGPLIVLTLGFALIIVNAILLYILDFLSPNLTIETIPALVYSSLLIGAINFLFHLATKN